MLKLCIPIDYRPEGGMYTFLANFTEYLEAHHVPVTRRVDDEFDVLFVNSWAVPFETIDASKRRRPDVRVVQRVDGSAQDYGGYGDADDRQASVNLFADLTIFQSQYSRYSVREKFRVIAQDGPVIYNPVDLVRFHPAAGRAPSGRVRIASVAWSTNRGKGTWQIDRLAAENPDLDFVLCGRFEQVGAAPNVHVLGYLGRDDLAEALRGCDLFLNLSENDPCPNVVLEALASGLPVIYRNSGGVPELVGECGVALDGIGFREAFDAAWTRRGGLAAAARARAERLFAPSAIFPRYLEAIAAATRRPLPTASEIAALQRAGYPVALKRSTRVEALAREAFRRSPVAVQNAVHAWRDRRSKHDVRPKPHRVGWVTHDSFPGRKRRFDQLEPFTRMRTGWVADWINAHSQLFHNELYRPGDRYDVVVFQKMMDERCQAEVERIHASGGRVIFDANVNYYEIEGDYLIPGTRPTAAQQRDARWMTAHADHVVADSSYLAGVIRPINPHVTWIPDNVNLDVYARTRVHRPAARTRLAWSGVAHKAPHLLMIREALAALSNVELMLVSDRIPDGLETLEAHVPCRVITPFSERRYAQLLLDCDIIISPKRLCNAYEVAHTEYKIALGMAAGLPAVASPQQSYVEILAGGGGIVADTPEEWVDALRSLSQDVDRRAAMGACARQTVVERYSTGVIALRYAELLSQLVPVTVRTAPA